MVVLVDCGGDASSQALSWTGMQSGIDRVLGVTEPQIDFRCLRLLGLMEESVESVLQAVVRSLTDVFARFKHRQVSIASRLISWANSLGSSLSGTLRSEKNAEPATAIVSNPVESNGLHSPNEA